MFETSHVVHWLELLIIKVTLCKQTRDESTSEHSLSGSQQMLPCRCMCMTQRTQHLPSPLLECTTPA